MYEDLSLESVADLPSWVNGNLLGLHYAYPTRHSRQCRPVDAHLMELVPENITVSDLSIVPVGFLAGMKSRLHYLHCQWFYPKSKNY